MMIADRNIVLKKEGDRLYLPTTEQLYVAAPRNTPSKDFIYCRTLSYDENSGTLQVKAMPDIAYEYMYRISIEVNSALFLSIEIKKVVFEGTTPTLLWGGSPASPFTVQEAEKNLDDLSKKWAQRQDLVDNSPSSKLEHNQNIVSANSTSNKWEHNQNHFSANITSNKKVVDLEIFVPVNDLRFLDRKVVFDHYINPDFQKVPFEIHNSFIKKEFDSIKNYFSKVFTTKKFAVHIHVETLEKRLLKCEATSPQVSQINADLFERVEDLCLWDDIVNNTEDEIVNLAKQGIKSGKKIGSENLSNTAWLLGKLLNEGKTKHYYHLRYLSSKNVNEVFPLHITGKPLSFIFLLLYNDSYFIIWETYSTQEATYIWRLSSEHISQLKTQIQERLDLIKVLRKNNKMGYLRSEPTEFKRIEHDYSGPDMGFNKWKSQLETFMKK